MAESTAAATVAWLLDTRFISHPQPFFAPAAALIVLAQVRGQQTQRADAHHVIIRAGREQPIFVGLAWTHYERAKAAAREAESAALLAHATAEQTFVLIDLDEPGAYPHPSVDELRSIFLLVVVFALVMQS